MWGWRVQSPGGLGGMEIEDWAGLRCTGEPTPLRGGSKTRCPLRVAGGARPAGLNPGLAPCVCDLSLSVAAGSPCLPPVDKGTGSERAWCLAQGHSLLPREVLGVQDEWRMQVQDGALALSCVFPSA